MFEQTCKLSDYKEIIPKKDRKIICLDFSSPLHPEFSMTKQKFNSLLNDTKEYDKLVKNTQKRLPCINISRALIICSAAFLFLFNAQLSSAYAVTCFAGGLADLTLKIIKGIQDIGFSVILVVTLYNIIKMATSGSDRNDIIKEFIRDFLLLVMLYATPNIYNMVRAYF